MMGLGIQNSGTENVDKPPQRFFQRHLGSGVNLQGGSLLKGAIEIGVRLDDMEMRILRLRVIGILLGESHICNRLPVAVLGFDIASVLRFPCLFLDGLEETVCTVQGRLIARCPCILAQSVHHEPQAVELFLGVRRVAQTVHFPIGSAILRVDEIAEDVIPGACSSLEILAIPQNAIGCREGPQDTCIEDSSLVGLRHQGTVAPHLPIEATILAVHHLPEPEG